MKKILLACDLDNTLIFSFKHKKNEDVCVEINKGKEQSFMTPRACELLQRLNKKISFVPVTTRSVEQYCRITWKDVFIPPYAVTTNGAILLQNNERHTEWCTTSKNLIASFQNEMENLLKRLSKQEKYIRCRIVDECYVFAYCADGVDIDECVREYQDDTSLTVIASGRKLYFFPPHIDKGTAVKKLKKLLNIDILICAGDSKIDLPMLEEANLAIVPSVYLAGCLQNSNVKICPNGTPFSEFVLEQALKAKIT